VQPREPRVQTVKKAVCSQTANAIELSKMTVDDAADLMKSVFRQGTALSLVRLYRQLRSHQFRARAAASGWYGALVTNCALVTECECIARKLVTLHENAEIRRAELALQQRRLAATHDESHDSVETSRRELETLDKLVATAVEEFRNKEGQFWSRGRKFCVPRSSIIIAAENIVFGPDFAALRCDRSINEYVFASLSSSSLSAQHRASGTHTALRRFGTPGDVRRELAASRRLAQHPFVMRPLRAIVEGDSAWIEYLTDARSLMLVESWVGSQRRCDHLSATSSIALLDIAGGLFDFLAVLHECRLVGVPLESNAIYATNRDDGEISSAAVSVTGLHLAQDASNAPPERDKKVLDMELNDVSSLVSTIRNFSIACSFHPVKSALASAVNACTPNSHATPAHLRTVSAQLRVARIAAEKEHHKQLADAAIAGNDNAPFYWRTASPGSSFEPRCVETVFVRNVLRVSFPSLRIDRVDRIESSVLWRAFLVECDRVRADLATMAKTSNSALITAPPLASTYQFVGSEKLAPPLNSVDLNVRYLFHGTSSVVADRVRTHGFDPSFAGASAGTVFGEGTYFASDPDFSARYARGACNARQGAVPVLIVARVLLGRFADAPGRSRKRPPDGFHSVISSKGAEQPLEYIVFRHTCAYPEFVVHLVP
jgi:hypothetical protein